MEEKSPSNTCEWFQLLLSSLGFPHWVNRCVNMKAGMSQTQAPFPRFYAIIPRPGHFPLVFRGVPWNVSFFFATTAVGHSPLLLFSWQIAGHSGNTMSHPLEDIHFPQLYCLQNWMCLIVDGEALFNCPLFFPFLAVPQIIVSHGTDSCPRASKTVTHAC